MKKIILGFTFLLVSTSTLFAYSVLSGEENDGYTRTCYYVDGSIVTVSGGGNCPLSN